MRQLVELGEATREVMEITERCRACGVITTEWAEVVLVWNTAHLDEVEVTDADPITVLCSGCADRAAPGLPVAVLTALTARLSEKS